MLDEFTHTIPGPPPGACVRAAAIAAGLCRPDPAGFAFTAVRVGAGAAAIGALLGAGAVAIGVEGATAVFVTGVIAVGTGAAATDFAPVVAPPVSVYQSFTPLCPRQAPSFIAALVYVPSLQAPVDPAGTCAIATPAPNAATINTRKDIPFLMQAPRPIASTNLCSLPNLCSFLCTL